jgi:hypothetical protein
MQKYKDLADSIILFSISGLFAAIIKFFNDKKENTLSNFLTEAIICISTSVLAGSIATYFIDNQMVLFGIAGFASLIGYRTFSNLFVKWVGKKIKVAETSIE